MKDFTIDGYVTKNVEVRSTNSGQNDDKARNIVEGALLLLWGSLAYDSWQDKQTGQNRSKAYLKVREIGVIRPPQPKQYQQQGYQQYGQQPAYAPQQAPQQAPVIDLYDDDIPF